MDITKIKNLVKKNGDKFVFIENGEPEMVIMSFEEYERLARNGIKEETSRNIASESYADKDDFDELRRKGFQETEFVAPVSAVSSRPARLEDVRLEDLPL